MAKISDLKCDHIIGYHLENGWYPDCGYFDIVNQSDKWYEDSDIGFYAFKYCPICGEKLDERK